MKFIKEHIIIIVIISILLIIIIKANYNDKHRPASVEENPSQITDGNVQLYRVG